MNYIGKEISTQPGRKTLFVVVGTFLVCFPILSHLYVIVTISLSNWRRIPPEVTLSLFEKTPLVIAHVPIALIAAVLAYTSCSWQKKIRATRLAAFMWTTAAVSGHVLALVFC